MTAPRRSPAAVVFDCDGTLADTESLADRAWAQTLARYGYTLTTDDARAVVGHPYARNFDHFAARVDLGDPGLFRRRLRTTFLALFDAELRLHDDAVGVLRSLAESGTPVGVASSSSREHVQRVLARGELTGLVDVIVGSEDVAEHKPAPRPYLAAAAALGVPPEECTAVEDTGVGVASAVAAGMYTVAVLRAHQRASDLAAAHRVVDHLDLDAVVRPEAPVPTERR